MNKKNILVIYTSHSTFVKKDIEFLSKKYDVKKYHFALQKGVFKNLYQIIKELLFFIINIWKIDIIFIWFSDFHSTIPILFSQLFKKKSLLVIGGYDATGIKKINYGIYYANKIRKYFNKISIKYANYILPVDKSLIENSNKYAIPNKSIPVGIYNITKNIHGSIIELPTGYDYNFWKRNYSINRNNDVMCVAGIKNDDTWKLKGGDLLLEIAKITPEINFHFYGVSANFKNELESNNIPSNFHIHGYINNTELPDIYSKHKVYAQFSLSEGLPNVLCESMLCECIPVGSNVNGIPVAIDDVNYILFNKNINEGRKLILKALKEEEKTGIKFRKKIITKFNQQKREKKLLELME